MIFDNLHQVLHNYYCDSVIIVWDMHWQVVLIFHVGLTLLGMLNPWTKRLMNLWTKWNYYPMLIGSHGLCASLNLLFIVAEEEIGPVILRRMSLIQLVMILMRMYLHVFNIEYWREGKYSFSFLEAVLLNDCDVAKKCTVVNKILQDQDNVYNWRITP